MFMIIVSRIYYLVDIIVKEEANEKKKKLFYVAL